MAGAKDAAKIREIGRPRPNSTADKGLKKERATRQRNDESRERERASERSSARRRGERTSQKRKKTCEKKKKNGDSAPMGRSGAGRSGGAAVLGRLWQLAAPHIPYLSTAPSPTSVPHHPLP
eukprot:318278-Rhodomonas_salina.1